MNLTVATWNIYIFGDRNAEGMAEVIDRNDIDVIGIQEAGIYFDGKEKLNVVKEIAEELDYHYEFVEALDFRQENSDREYKMGNAIISRYPIGETEKYSLNPDHVEYDGNPENEPRVAVKGRIDCGDQRIDFITAHLQYTNEFTYSDIRKAEVQNLLEIVENAENPAVLAGDFNCKSDNEEIRIIREEMERISDDSNTWTAMPFDYNGWQVEGLEYRVDDIYFSGFEEISSSTIQTEISDHLPVKAILQLKN